MLRIVAMNTLGWTTPRVRLPKQADRWTWLVVAAYTQLRLARGLLADHKLPWERRATPARSPHPHQAVFPWTSHSARHPRQSTKTQQGRPWPRTPQRQPPRPRRALPGHQEGGVTPIPEPKSQAQVLLRLGR